METNAGIERQMERRNFAKEIRNVGRSTSTDM